MIQECVALATHTAGPWLGSGDIVLQSVVLLANIRFERSRTYTGYIDIVRMICCRQKYLNFYPSESWAMSPLSHIPITT
jgi:hypothetical protein